MRKAIVLSVVAVMALSIGAAPASAVPVSKWGVPNTYTGSAIVEDAGYFGAPAGTQASLFSFIGSEVSLDPTLGIVNLPQAGPAASPVAGIPPPAGALLELTAVKDGPDIPVPAEMTAVLGGLWPANLFVRDGTWDDLGLAPGSTAGDGNPDQITAPDASSGLSAYRVEFGPSVAGFPYPAPPVFEIYDDIPPGLNMNIGSAPPVLAETHMDFDGTPIPGPLGPKVPPVTAAPSQFVNLADQGAAGAFMPVPPNVNQVSAATDGSLWAAGWIDYARADYIFFDNAVLGSGGFGGGKVYAVEFTAKGRVTEGAILPLLGVLELGTAFDGGDINITFAATVYGVAYPTSVAGPPYAATDGVDPFATWDVRTSTAANSGDGSLTILPIPEPSTMALLGIGLVPLFFRRRKKSV